MTAPKLVITGLEKRFGAKRVLAGVDLTLAAGESLVVLGGSGTGKSVLLKCVLGLLRPEAGSVRLDGVELTGLRGRALARARAQIGMLFQGGALFDSLPVWENVAFAPLRRGLARAAARERAAAALAQVGLGPEALDLRPAELSGGMQKRVGLARALVAEPRLIFFDEPTTGLDPILARVIDELIVATVRRLGVAAITITHDLRSARTVADRVALLHEGRIRWQGPVAALDRSGDPYVAQFVEGRADGPIRMALRG